MIDKIDPFELNRTIIEILEKINSEKATYVSSFPAEILGKPDVFLVTIWLEGGRVKDTQHYISPYDRDLEICSFEIKAKEAANVESIIKKNIARFMLLNESENNNR